MKRNTILLLAAALVGCCPARYLATSTADYEQVEQGWLLYSFGGK